MFLGFKITWLWLCFGSYISLKWHLLILLLIDYYVDNFDFLIYPPGNNPCLNSIIGYLIVFAKGRVTQENSKHKLSSRKLYKCHEILRVIPFIFSSFFHLCNQWISSLERTMSVCSGLPLFILTSWKHVPGDNKGLTLKRCTMLNTSSS